MQKNATLLKLVLETFLRYARRSQPIPRRVGHVPKVKESLSKNYRSDSTQACRPLRHPAQGDERTTLASTVSLVVVKTATTEIAVQKLHDNYDLNQLQLQYHIGPFQGHQSVSESYCLLNALDGDLMLQFLQIISILLQQV